MKYILLDGADNLSLDDIYNRFAETMRFPEWFGRNLDALYDCLTEPGEQVMISVIHKTALENKKGGRGLLLVLRDAYENAGRIILTMED